MEVLTRERIAFLRLAPTTADASTELTVDVASGNVIVINQVRLSLALVGVAQGQAQGRSLVSLDTGLDLSDIATIGGPDGTAFSETETPIVAAADVSQNVNNDTTNGVGLESGRDSLSMIAHYRVLPLANRPVTSRNILLAFGIGADNNNAVESIAFIHYQIARLSAAELGQLLGREVGDVFRNYVPPENGLPAPLFTYAP